MRTCEYTDINYKDIPSELTEDEKREYELLNDSEFMNRFELYMQKQSANGAITFYQNRIKTNGYVGVIRYKNFQLDILPKLLSKVLQTADDEGNSNQEDLNFKEDDVRKVLKNLTFMITKTQKLEIKVTERSDINHCDNPFLEVLIREYAFSLFECLKRLTPRNYVREEENLNFLKGKLKFIENIRYNCANKAKFYCEYDEFSENNELNRLFLFVSKCLFTISRSSENKKVLSFIMNYFCDLPFERTDKYKAEKIILNRNQKLFEHPFKLAKLFLEHISIDISQKNIENITLLWSMDKLFEEFISELIKNNQSEYSVTIQKNYPLLRNQNGTEYERKQTLVDVYLEKNEDKQKIILDAKYKINKFETNDIYQVSTYCLLHDSHNAVLLSPMSQERKVDDNNKYFQLNKKSYNLNTENYDIRIDRIYVNLFLDDLNELYSYDSVKQLVKLLNGILEDTAEKEKEKEKTIRDILNKYIIEDKAENTVKLPLMKINQKKNY